MPPHIESFPPAQLAKRVQYKTNGKVQKPPIDLKACELKEMIQYFCDLDGPREHPGSKVVCAPYLRMFRK